MEYSDYFPELISLGNIRLVKTKSFEIGRLDAGWPDSPPSLIRDGVIYRAEKFFSMLSGKKIECMNHYGTIRPDALEDYYLGENDDGVFYAKGFKVSNDYQREALQVWMYDHDAEEIGDWLYFVNYTID